MLHQLLQTKTKDELTSYLLRMGLFFSEKSDANFLITLIEEQELSHFVDSLSPIELNEILYQFGLDSENPIHDQKEVFSILQTGKNTQGVSVILWGDREIKENITLLRALFSSQHIEYIQQGIALFETLSYSKTMFLRLMRGFGYINFRKISELYELQYLLVEKETSPTDRDDILMETYNTHGIYASLWLLAIASEYQITTNITELDLRKSDLSELPENIGNLTQLTHLNLYNNQLTSLPASFGNLTQLVSLNLWENELTSLPDSIGNLTQLTKLHLRRNQLTSLPESFGNLTQLTDLNLEANQLSYLPKNFGNMTKLHKLFLRKNQLTSLPQSFGNLNRQNFLDLSENRFSSVPTSLAKLSQLRYIKLSLNPITIEEIHRFKRKFPYCRISK